MEEGLRVGAFVVYQFLEFGRGKPPYGGVRDRTWQKGEVDCRVL